MWLPGGLLFLFAFCLARLAGSPAIGSNFEMNWLLVKLSPDNWNSLRKRLSRLSVGLQQLFNELKPRPRNWIKLYRFRIFLVAPFLLTLAGCFNVKPNPLPEPTATPKPVFECIDKALRLCPGVVPIEVTDCKIVTQLASSALTALETCQSYHAELILCVLDYIQQGSKKQDG